MGSSRTIANEQEVYDEIYAIACDVLKAHDVKNIRMKEIKQKGVDVPTEYVYLDQIHGGYRKHTLQHEVYNVPVDFLCEINVAHGNIARGRQISKAMQVAFFKKASSCGFVVKDALATDAVMTTGHKFVVSLELTYTIRMV